MCLERNFVRRKRGRVIKRVLDGHTAIVGAVPNERARGMLTDALIHREKFAKFGIVFVLEQVGDRAFMSQFWV